MEDIKVSVVKYPDRKYLMLRYVDPLTGRQKTKSAKTTNKREAEKAAGKWEAELREGRHACPSKTTWDEFREQYESEVLTGQAGGTDEKASGVFNSVEEILNPARLRDVTTARLSHYQAELRKLGRAESTIKSHLAHVKAALRWAERVGLLPKAPLVEMPKRAKGTKGTDPMKGRPITREEFERMLDKTTSVVGEAAAASWLHYLNGLWTSGLRLAESLELSWDDDARLGIDLTGRYPMLRIPAEAEKGNKDRMLPMAPEFARFLAETPEVLRVGPVFRPLNRIGTRASRNTAIRTVAAIGKAASIKVNTDARGKVKYASAHDLRRSFGERWASRVMPQVLMGLMRHESIETTLRFYVGRNAQTTAAVLWEAEKAATQTASLSGHDRTVSQDTL